MKAFIIFILLVVVLQLNVKADHITGGEMYYTFIGVANNENLYKCTLKLFMRCNSGRQFANPTIVSIFSKATGIRIRDVTVQLINQQQISLANNNACITNPPVVCYEVGLYEFNFSVPPSPDGYILASQVNYRIAGISNLIPNYGLIGATYTAEIPGTSTDAGAPINNSAHFTGSDLVVVCANNSMSYSFAAQDADGDQLEYSFCEAYQSGTSSQGTASPPPPYQSVPYGSGFSGSAPLAGLVHINPHSGLITGIAPPAGIYVVTVCVNEIRNGVVIATQRKDLQINIASCSIAAATLLPLYMLCKTTKTLTIANLSTSPLIHSYYWEFINKDGAQLYSSTEPSPTYTFADTGIYKIKLLVNKSEPCSDSTQSIATVYPGFVPGFTYSGICFTKPTFFTDQSSSVYGTVNSWSWDFGESGSSVDVSNQPNSFFTYPTMGNKEVQLIVSNSKGCIDTATRIISIVNKPPINLSFKDTLICIPDAVQLGASGNGKFTWSPNIRINNPNTPTPTVFPLVSTMYYVELNEDGCRNKDSVNVRVTDHVSVTAMDDTTICQDDPIQLRSVSDGLRFSWTPAGAMINPFVQNPTAVTHLSTRYEVTARIGSCSAKDQVVVSTVPYPFVNAGADTMLCYGDPARLNGYSDGKVFKWTPSSGLSDPTILKPFARPKTTTNYVLLAYDNKGCPKPGTDTVLVQVLPNISAFAGRDTSAVIGQPLQLNATGGLHYIWSPAIGLSSTRIASPVAIYNNETSAIHYRVLVFNEAGCVDSAFVNVKVFGTEPKIFVPNAFSPNHDSHNDLLKPILAGMKRMEYFRVYSRWGQLVYSTSQEGSGWDGKLADRLQSEGTYVWMVKGVDYKGKEYFEKGVVMLIR